MINGVSDALKLAGQLSPVSQTVKTPATGHSHQSLTPQVVVGQFRAQAFERWAKMTEAQHRISSAQVAIAAQAQMLSLLKQMLSLLPKGSQQETQAKLQQMRSQLMQLQPNYLGIPLLDQQLNLRLNQKQAPKRKFRLKSIKLLASKPRDEQLAFQLPTEEGPVLILVSLPANTDAEALCTLLNQSLNNHGIQITSLSGEAVMECEESLWSVIKDGLFVKGQGQRLPAGEPQQIKTIELLNWQDPREWDLSSPQGLQQSEIKLKKTCRKLEQQIQHTKAQLQFLGKVLHSQPDAPEPELLNAINAQFAPSPFSGQLKALLAQANLGRNQAKDLLKDI